LARKKGEPHRIASPTRHPRGSSKSNAFGIAGTTAMTSRFTPEGWRTVTPRIVARGTQELVDFINKVFDATGEYRADLPSVLTIGDSMVMISEAGVRGVTPAFLYVYVADADATYQRALAAGAISIEEPTDTPYGDRRAMVNDRWGNTWQIATVRRLAAG
jgi:PhnB protein